MVTIRRATVEDAELLAKLNVHVHEAHRAIMPERYKPITGAEPALIAWFENLSDDTTVVLIAERDNKAVGYIVCFLQEHPENVFLYARTTLHIDQMSVNDGYRGQGIGQALMNEVLQVAQSLAVDNITVGVMAFNADAIRFYERNGFTLGSHKMTRTISGE